MPSKCTNKKKISMRADDNENVSYHLNVEGTYFKFIEVPADGDCFYHSVSQSPLSDTFQSIFHLRSYMKDFVLQKIEHDTSLQRIFTYDKLNPTTWYQHITTMETWAISLERLIFTYLLKCAVITIGNCTKKIWLRPSDNGNKNCASFIL